MRSALYRRPGVLKQAGLGVLPVPTRTRLWSSETGKPQATNDRFPLYRPAEEQHQPPPPSQSRYSSPSQLPSDKRIRQTVKAQLTEKALEDLPELQEDELREFYAAVMESGKEEAAGRRMLEAPDRVTRRTQRLSAGERQGIVDGLAQRLLSPSDQAGPSSLPAHPGQAFDGVRKVVDKLRHLPQHQDSESPIRVSMGLVSPREWEALLEQTIESGSAVEAEEMLGLMSTHGESPTNDQVTRVMERFAYDGKPADVARLHDAMRSTGLELRDEQHDLLIQAHLSHSPPLTADAINLMSSLAASGNPLPQSSYHLLLAHLTASNSVARNRALAQDLFVNMRLNAHPQPTLETYSTMITACANSRDPQPERARDLWIEITESGLEPTRREYDAIIRAMSSTKKTYLEAFDLFRQMLAKHADATFVPFDETDQKIEKWSRYVPTAETFRALLEGTKRAGDLSRARWVLNEVVRLQASGLGHGWRGADADLLSGVFMTYASWKPVVRRTNVKESAKLETSSNEPDKPNSIAAHDEDSHHGRKVSAAAEDTGTVVDDALQPGDISADVTDTPYTAPMSSADAIREADALFDRILADQASSSEGGPFSHVRLTTRLVNAYLSVHLAHAPNIPAARKVHDRTWITCDKHDVHPNAWTYLHVLERCAAGDIGTDRQVASIWADKTWTQYTAFAGQHGFDFASTSALSPPKAAETIRRDLYLLGLGPRQLERSFRAMIRIKALNPSMPINESLDLLARFHTLFPPAAILQTYTPSAPMPFQIRMTDPTATAESDIPPVMLWPDVDVVHQRLAREGRRKDINWLTWLTKSYEVNIRQRRRWRLKKRGEPRPKSASLTDEVSTPSIDDASSVSAQKAIGNGESATTDSVTGV